VRKATPAVVCRTDKRAAAPARVKLPGSGRGFHSSTCSLNLSGLDH
jgi:hypothetical protein